MGSTVMTVRPIRILSPFFSHWVAWMRRPFSQVPLVEPRSSTYHRPRATWKRAWRPEAEFVVDDEAAFPAYGEFGIEGAAAAGRLDAQGPGRHRLGTGDFPLPRDGGRCRPPGRLFLRTDIFPRRQRRGMGSAVGLIGVSC